MLRKRPVALAVWVFAFQTSCSLKAEITTTYGTVSNRSGALIPGVEVTAVNTDTNTCTFRTIQARRDVDGHYQCSLHCRALLAAPKAAPSSASTTSERQSQS